MSGHEDWIDKVQEQEDRQFWGKPTRHTTIGFWKSKMTYEEFIEYTRKWGLQSNLRSGERFMEDWMELFCSYHEIEYQTESSEAPYRNRTIDLAIEAELERERLEKDANL